MVGFVGNGGKGGFGGKGGSGKIVLWIGVWGWCWIEVEKSGEFGKIKEKRGWTWVGFFARKGKQKRPLYYNNKK